MKKKRSRRKPTKPPPAGASRPQPRRRPGRPTLAKALPRELQYKVVELSTVDEGSLERTLNEWTAKGWSLENVQFAMRESSKRPAMAFVFFTREAEVAEERAPERGGGAREKLRRLAGLPDGEAAALTAAAIPVAAPELSPGEVAVRTAVELAAAALFDVSPAEAEQAGSSGRDEENGAVRWVELPEENDE